MKDYKDNFYNAIDYAIKKTKAPAYKLILLGIMGSLYVAIAYVAFIIIIANFDGVITEKVIAINGVDTVVGKTISLHSGALITAAAIFPVGIILIIFLGGSLFTSDNLTMIAWITKKTKLLPIVIKWMYTLIGNVLGGFLAGAIIRAGNVLGTENYQLILGYLSGKKIALEWYYVIFSGILCNIIVAGSVWASLAAKHSSAKLFIIYFPIWLFAIVGFQHVVANAILFAMTWFYSINPDEHKAILAGINLASNDAVHHLGWVPNFIINHTTPETGLIGSGKDQISVDAAKQINYQWINLGNFSISAIFANLLPASLGNWFSGAIILPYAYYWLSGWKREHKDHEDQNGNNQINTQTTTQTQTHTNVNPKS